MAKTTGTAIAAPKTAAPAPANKGPAVKPAPAAEKKVVAKRTRYTDGFTTDGDGNITDARYPFDFRTTKVAKDGLETEVQVATPEGFNPKKHIPLNKKDFKTPKAFFTYKYEIASADAAKYLAKANEEVAVKDQKQAAGAKRFVKVAAQMELLRAQLAKQGLDVDALLAKAKQNAEKATEETPAPQA
jgi:hypothetical protein